MTEAVVYLVPIGAGRFELYSEPSEEPASGGPLHGLDGLRRRQLHRLHERWRRAAHTAHQYDASSSRLARARDWMVRRVAESIAEQRTLWLLRGAASATFVYPADLADASAVAVRERLLTHARQHHGRFLLLNVVGVAATAVLVLLPGPNLIGYYFVFRMIGHYLSWRGARQALDRLAWRARAEPALAELGHLAPLPRAARAERVERLAAGLHLPRLAAFFDRAAIPAR